MKEHILKYTTKGIRYDSRKLTDYREVSVTTGVSHSAEGSACVKIGQTEVIAGVKLSLEKPYPDTPSQGNLMISAELTPMSSPEFETGPPGPQAIELARVIDRGVRESKAIDLTKLCVKEGEKVWNVAVDIVTVNADGNLFDAGALAVIAALKNATFPKVEDEKVNYNEKTTEKLPIVQTPIAVTVLKIGDQLIVDPTPEEEKALDARLTVAFNDAHMLCAMQKGGETPLTLDEIKNMVDLALTNAKNLRKKL